MIWDMGCVAMRVASRSFHSAKIWHPLGFEPGSPGRNAPSLLHIGPHDNFFFWYVSVDLAFYIQLKCAFNRLVFVFGSHLIKSKLSKT